MASDPRFSRELAEQTGYVPHSILAVPVETPQRTLGVISLLDRDPARPGAEQDMALLSLFADQAALALASVETFGMLGRVLLAALADAAAGDDLALALRRAAEGLPAADRDLATLAAAFSALARRGPAERRLALAVLRDVAEYAEGRPSRPALRPAWSDAFAPEALRPVPRIDLPIDKDWAWGGATGAGIAVAVVDSGVDAAHPAVGAIERTVALQRDPETEMILTAEGSHDDLFGHGTACAGIIRRAAPNAALWSVRVLGSKLTGKGMVFAAGLRWSIAEGARVVNLSLSTGREDYYGLFHQIADEAAFAGVVLVCAVNNVPAPTYPAQFSSVISVAAHDGRDPFGLDANPAPPGTSGHPGSISTCRGCPGPRSSRPAIPSPRPT